MTCYRKWDADQAEKVATLYKAGLEPHQIGQAVGESSKRIRSKLQRMGVARPNKRVVADADLGQQMHELARYRLTLDECAVVLSITLEKAFELAEWYCVKFDGSPIDTTLVETMMVQKKTAKEIAAFFGCSHQKATAVMKPIRARRQRELQQRMARDAWG